jgi:hypothetical protein
MLSIDEECYSLTLPLSPKEEIFHLRLTDGTNIFARVEEHLRAERASLEKFLLDYFSKNFYFSLRFEERSERISIILDLLCRRSILLLSIFRNIQGYTSHVRIKMSL